MVFCNIYVPANTTIFPVDVRTVQKALFLPEASTNQGRILTFKDQFGACSTNAIAISTTGADVLDGGRVSSILNFTNGSFSFVSDGSNIWRQIGFYDGSVVPLLSTSATPVTFSPTCMLWLDATDPDTVIQSGGVITNWLDKSGNGYDATGYNSPVVTNINNRPAIQLGGLNNFDGSITPQSNITVFAVGLNDGSEGPTGYFRLVSLATFGTTNDSTTPEFVVPLENPNSITSIGAERNTGTNPVYNAGTQSIQTNIPFLACSTWTNASVEIYVNGSNKVASNYSWINEFTFSNYAVGRSILVDNSGSSPTNVWPGSVGEVIVYGSALSAVERQQVEGYLAWKWNLQSNLPPFHLYKNYPPISPNSPLINNAIVTYGLEKNLDAAYYNYVNGSNWLAMNGTFMTLYNRPFLNKAPGGQTVLSFNGSNDYAMDQNGTTATSNFSIDLWFYPTDSNGSVVSELGQPGSPTQGYKNAVFQLVNGFGRVGFFTGALRNYINLGPIEVNTWNQVSWTYDGTTLRGYLNGYGINSARYAKILPTRSYYALAAATNGSNFGTNSYFKGYIGSFKFYNSILTASQVLQNYQAFASQRYGLSSNPSPPGVSWSIKLDGNGSATDLADGNWSIIGPNDVIGDGWSYIYTQFLTSGNFTYGYNYTCTDAPGFDWLFDTVSISPLSNPSNVDFNNKVAVSNGDTGNRTLFYNVGDWVAIGIYSTDSSRGRGIALLNGIPSSNTPPEPPISSIASPLDIPNCAVWFDPTNAESIRLLEGTHSTVAAWSNLGLQGGSMVQNSGEAITSSFKINASTAMYFAGNTTMTWFGSILNQEKTSFYVLETTTNPIFATFPNYRVFSGTNYRSVEIGANILYGDVYSYINRSGDWSMYGNSNQDFYRYPQVFSQRITQDLAQNLININTSSITLIENHVAELFDNTAQTYFMGRTDVGTTFKIGDFILYNRALTDEELNLVDQYLVNKWSINSTSPPPPDLLGIWFDASDLTSLTWDTGNNNRVTSWSNKGLLSNIAYPNPVDPQPPQTRIELQNGLNVVSFNLTYPVQNDYLRLAPFSLQSGDKTCAVILNLKEALNNVSPPYEIRFLQGDNNSTNDFSFILAYYLGTFVATVNAYYNFTLFGYLPSIVNDYVLLTLVAVQNPATPGVGIWLNGSNINNNWVSASDNRTASIEYFVGGAPGFKGPPFNLGEMRVYYTAFDTTARQLLEGEMAWKWGIQSSLPPDHPYYFSPP